MRERARSARPRACVALLRALGVDEATCKAQLENVKTKVDAVKVQKSMAPVYEKVTGEGRPWYGCACARGCAIQRRKHVSDILVRNMNIKDQFGARRPHDEDDDLAAERESDARRVWRSRGHGARWRGGDKAGDEAEESPSHEGTMRARGEVSVELHGVPRLPAWEAAQSMQGVRWFWNLRARSWALSVQGVRWCINLRARSSARCKECGGSAICEHGRQRSKCSAVGLKSASTVVSALSARSAVGLKSASMVVTLLLPEGLEYASTVVYALTARSAVGAQSASTVLRERSSTRKRFSIVFTLARATLSAAPAWPPSVISWYSTLPPMPSARILCTTRRACVVGAQSASTRSQSRTVRVCNGFWW